MILTFPSGILSHERKRAKRIVSLISLLFLFGQTLARCSFVCGVWPDYSVTVHRPLDCAERHCDWTVWWTTPSHTGAPLLLSLSIVLSLPHTLCSAALTIACLVLIGSSKSPGSRNVTECHSSPSETLLLFIFFWSCLLECVHWFHRGRVFKDMTSLQLHSSSPIVAIFLKAIWYDIRMAFFINYISVMAVVMGRHHWSPVAIFLWGTQPWRQISWPDLVYILKCHQWWKSQNHLQLFSFMRSIHIPTLTKTFSFKSRHDPLVRYFNGKWPLRQTKCHWHVRLSHNLIKGLFDPV